MLDLPSAEPSDSPRFMFQEYWVDFLGGLLPGTLFLVSTTLAFFPLFVILFNISSLNFEVSFVDFLLGFLVGIEVTPGVIWLALGIAFIALSYVLGHLFYRQDPKVPNQRSFRLLNGRELQKLKEDNDKRPDTDKWSDEEIKQTLLQICQKDFACTSEDDCEFPFPFFHIYLRNRGLIYLESLVIWKNDFDYRTKNWINILKIRLKLYYPNRCSTIIRNEAHVRLATSTWYVGKAIRTSSKISLLGQALSVFLFIILKYKFLEENAITSNSEFVVNNIFALISSSTIYFMGLHTMMRIETFLHYQRQREVVHVLETAWAAFRSKPSLLNPPFEEYASSFSK